MTREQAIKRKLNFRARLFHDFVRYINRSEEVLTGWHLIKWINEAGREEVISSGMVTWMRSRLYEEMEKRLEEEQKTEGAELETE